MNLALIAPDQTHTAVSVVRPRPCGRAPMSHTPLPAAGRRLDAESIEWLAALSASGPRREAAVERLHALLLRAVDLTQEGATP
jgi:hypothetical protein